MNPTLDEDTHETEKHTLYVTFYANIEFYNFVMNHTFSMMDLQNRVPRHWNLDELPAKKSFYFIIDNEK